ncbi:MAG TPA: spore coat protein U domain-containing protein [Stellaceae bacterium]|jgi:spore coat protein U-like protein
MIENFARKSIGGVAFAAALVLANSFAYAGNTVNIALSSTVANACSLATSTSSVTLGDLQVTPANNTPVATLTEACNDAAGYSVKLASANATSGSQLFLKGTTNATNTINYSLSYNNAAVTYSGGTATITTSTSPTTSATGVTKSLNITTPAGFYATDTYADTLTITLSAS